MILLEVSTEAGRKIGGIYTVLRSKAPHIKAKLGDDYFLIGMYDEKCDSDVKFCDPPKELRSLIEQLEKEESIQVKFGRWIYGDDAQLLLINMRGLLSRKVHYIDNGMDKVDSFVNYYKFLLWKHFSVDSLMDNSWDISESIAFGVAAGKLIEKILPVLKKRDPKVVCHFHEWLTGPGLLYCKMSNLAVGTVFTTHATILGRTLSSHGRDVYAEAANSKVMVNQSDAYHYHIEAKHQIEQQSALKSNVFTTVSDTVGIEVKYIHGRSADVVTLNGMDFGEKKAKNGKKKLLSYVRNELMQFIEAYFVPYYNINMRNCKIIYISGRYEYTNKGFDIFVDSLAKLNEILKRSNYRGSVVGVIFSPSSISGPRDNLIKNYLLADKMSEVLQEVGVKDYFDTIGSTITAIDSVEDEQIKHELNTMKKGFRKDGDLPPINAFNLSYGNDSLINHCYSKGLMNREEDPVKIIFYPTYVNPNDGLLNMEYYTLLEGTDIGIFPSRYEPFGYTPVEAGLTNNISITSDTTGFGRYIETRLGDRENIERGVIVLKMFQQETDKVNTRLAGLLNELLMLNPKEFSLLQADANKVVRLCDWKDLVKNYFKAYDMALGKKG